MESSNKITRREAVRALVAASVGAIMPAQLSGTREPVKTPHDFAPVRECILKAIADEKATGVAVAVVQGGRIVWEDGFGWANREAGLKVTPHTPFSLASITKPFTTTTDDLGSRGKTLSGRPSQHASSEE